jgi:hypothetical protein
MQFATQRDLVMAPNTSLRAQTGGQWKFKEEYPGMSYGPPEPRWKWLSQVVWPAYLKIVEKGEVREAIDRARGQR